jgi:hypothetical protein
MSIGIRLGATGLMCRPLRWLRNSNATRHTEPQRWWSSDQRSEPPEILSDGGQNKLILGASGATQSKPSELQDTLEVREPHLDLFALTP